MTERADNLFIVTGAPGAGKTTLLAAAAEAGMTIGQEAARAVIQAQAAIDGPAVQWLQPAMFAELMLDRDIQIWQTLRDAGEPVLCDRGIPDRGLWAHAETR
jgi:predicted ATPase